MSLSSLCELFGYTRQGYWKQRQEHYREEIDTTALLNEVRMVRVDMPRCGVRKLQVILEEKGHNIGRDRLFALLRLSRFERVTAEMGKGTHTKSRTRRQRFIVSGGRLARAARFLGQRGQSPLSRFANWGQSPFARPPLLRGLYPAVSPTANFPWAQMHI